MREKVKEVNCMIDSNCPLVLITLCECLDVKYNVVVLYYSRGKKKKSPSSSFSVSGMP